MQAISQVQHFFVLMLENRSFDHVFGFSGIKGVEPPEHLSFADPSNASAQAIAVTASGADALAVDPPHEFADVCFQITGSFTGNYSSLPSSPLGFAASASYGSTTADDGEKQKLRAARGNGQYALQCLSRDKTPVLSALAESFVLCDRWFSSMPGPTWPNRFFVHAGSSGGLDNSPSALRSVGAVLLDSLGFAFQNGTIYDRLGPDQWRIYHGDAFPQVLAIKDMAIRYSVEKGRHSIPVVSKDRAFRGIDHLPSDLNDLTAQFPKYVFIEPSHDARRNGLKGNSQHPPGTFSAGEALVKFVYESIRNSPLWSKSALVITYDEHGGFFDRLVPPAGIPPGDSDKNRRKGERPAGFGFDLLGVRVPAIVVSPWVPAGLIDSTQYDHTSILRTVCERFDLPSLTNRDKHAASLAQLFNLDSPRLKPAEAPTALPSPYEEGLTLADAEADSNPVHNEQQGFLRIAAAIKKLVQDQKISAGQKAWRTVRDTTSFGLLAEQAPSITTQAQVRTFLDDVESMLQKD